SGQGVNILNSYYAYFPKDLPDMYHSSTVAVSLDFSSTYFGISSLKLVASGTDGWCFLGAAADDYNTKILSNRTWMVHAFVKSSSANKSGQIFLYLSDGSWEVSNFTISSANSWQRVSAIFDLSTNTSTNCLLRF